MSDTIKQDEVCIRFIDENVKEDKPEPEMCVERNVKQAMFHDYEESFLKVDINGIEFWYMTKDEVIELYKWIGRALGRDT